MMSAYYLRKNVFCCLANGHLVFLDLDTDKYLCLDQERSKIYPNLWTDKLHQSPDRSRDDELNTITQALIEQCLITQNPKEGASLCPPSLPQATETLATFNNTDMHANIRHRHIFRFIKAASIAAYRLRFQSLKHVVQQVKVRRSRYEKVLPEYDDAQARILVNSFTALRPLLPSKGQCLFDALALIEFLASYRLFPHWVFGVRMAPFTAHCWVQNENIVYTDPLDHIASLTPIMVA